jgi:hypothetical protein
MTKGLASIHKAWIALPLLSLVAWFAVGGIRLYLYERLDK